MRKTHPTQTTGSLTPAESRMQRRSPTRSGIVPPVLTSPGCAEPPKPRRLGMIRRKSVCAKHSQHTRSGKASVETTYLELCNLVLPTRPERRPTVHKK